MINQQRVSECFSLSTEYFGRNARVFAGGFAGLNSFWQRTLKEVQKGVANRDLATVGLALKGLQIEMATFKHEDPSKAELVDHLGQLVSQDLRKLSTLCAP